MNAADFLELFRSQLAEVLPECDGLGGDDPLLGPKRGATGGVHDRERKDEQGCHS